MNITYTSLPGVVLVEPRVLTDERGFFLETFRASDYQILLSPDMSFVQDNHSHSTKGVVRGLHFQTRKPQGKLVRVVRGEIFDVAVDINPDSNNFGKWYGTTLSAENRKQLYIPPGYAHGFQVLSQVTDVEYKCTDYYDPGGESGLIWNDSQVGIQWPLEAALLAEKDQQLPSLAVLAQHKHGCEDPSHTL